MVEEKDVGSLSSLIELHRVLEKHCLVRDDDLARKRFAEHRKYLHPIKYACLVVYIVVIPFLECPNWCLDKKKGTSEQTHFFLICSSYDVPYAGFPFVNPRYLFIFELCCLGVFALSRWYRR